MLKNRTLGDLYKRGRLLTLVGPVMDNDGTTSEETLTVYLKKLNPNEAEEAVRKANAARARVLAAIRDPESENYLQALNEVEDMNRDQQIESIISLDLSNRREAVESEMSEEPKWTEDGYLQGLFDAWNDGLNMVWIESRGVDDPEDPDKVKEAERVFDLLAEFRDAVDKEVEAHAIALRRDWEDEPDDKIREKALERELRGRSEITWMEEYRTQELLIGVRDPENHKQRYFLDRDDLDDQELPILIELIRAMRDLAVEPTEGKDSEETPAS